VLCLEQSAKNSALHDLLEDLEKPIRRLDARLSDLHDDLESPFSRPSKLATRGVLIFCRVQTTGGPEVDIDDAVRAAP
jgi:hypothetical protein